MPAASSGARSSDRLGGAWRWISAGRMRRATATVHTSSSGGQGAADHIAVPALGRKFWTITSCTWPWRRWLAAIASSASTRSARDSPMPTRIPVVNGMPTSPAASSVAKPPGRGLVGRPPVAVEAGVERLDHHPLRRRHRPQPGQLARRQRPRVGVGQQACLRQHQPAHGHQVVDRRLVAGGVEPVPGHRVAVLGGLAQGEQGFEAAGGRARPGDGQHLVGRQEGRRHPGRRLGEGAVAAPVPAQVRQWDEDLGREGDAGAGGGVPARPPPPRPGRRQPRRGVRRRSPAPGYDQDLAVGVVHQRGRPRAWTPGYRRTRRRRVVGLPKAS